jgi:hypothetical protein
VQIWKDFFFVLFEGVLYCYKDSKVRPQHAGLASEQPLLRRAVNHTG